MKRVEEIKIEILGPLGDIVNKYIINIPDDLYFVQEDETDIDFPKQDRAIITIGDKKYCVNRNCEIKELE
jgi:hypothetical protein